MVVYIVTVVSFFQLTISQNSRAFSSKINLPFLFFLPPYWYREHSVSFFLLQWQMTLNAWKLWWNTWILSGHNGSRQKSIINKGTDTIHGSSNIVCCNSFVLSLFYNFLGSKEEFASKNLLQCCLYYLQLRNDWNDCVGDWVN